MLIVSKEHDYYDTSHDGFIDKSIVYQRKPVQTKDFLKERLDYYRTGTKGKKINIEFPYVGGNLRALKFTENKDLFIVGFCGKLYVGLHHTKYDNMKCEDIIDRYIYDMDEMISCLGLKPDKKTKWSSKWLFGGGYTQFVDFYNKYNEKEYFQFFLDWKVPIFYIGSDRKVVIDFDGGGRKIILNPTLKEVEFFKVFDAKSAFLAIQTFISNILTNPEKEPEIPNKVKIESHGFDFKHSFRKDPTKPWKRKK